MMMKDSFNRRIDYLRVSITDRCNLKCVYCMPSGGLRHLKENEVLTDAEIVRIVRIACGQGLRKVRITGGEPLMRKNITGLVSSIKETGVHDLALTTNGIMLSGLAGELKKAGLDRVNISLDTMDPARYRAITNGGSLDRVWKAVEDAGRAGLSPVKINVVPVRGLNDDEIPAFASLTFENDYHIRFIEFMPAARDGTWRRDRCVSSAEVMERISALGALQRLEFRGRGPSRNFRIKGARGVIGIISPLSDHFCAFCNRLRLTADGKIRPCLFSGIKVDMRTPMRNGASDREMEKLFCKAVKLKPQKHLLNENTISPGRLRAMSEIGG